MATIRAFKYHGGVALADLSTENLPALETGLANLQRHVSNIKDRFSLPCVVSVNYFTADTDAELALIAEKMSAQSVPVVTARH